jgi:hypothetical protein
LHGTFLVVALATKAWRTRAAQVTGLARMSRVHDWLKVFVVFNLVAFAWIFFRANNMTDALYVVRHVAVGLNLRDALSADLATKLATPRADLLLDVVLIALLECVQFVQAQAHLWGDWRARPLWQRWALYYALVGAIIFLGEYQSQQFIYFQF